MPTVDYTVLRSYITAIFSATPLPSDQAAIVADHLVDSNLTGHDSHGVIRTPGYVKSLVAGTIRPVGNHKIVRESSTSLVIDAEHTSGIVLATQAMQMAVDRASEHTFGAVAVHQSSHIGRLGAYPPMAAEQDCIGLLLLNGGGRFTAPFGGTARRLPPNPISISVPTEAGPPMMLDITTSMVAGGKVEVQSARGQPVPEGWLIDRDGNTVLDPDLFRTPDVAMLPLGGPAGHKGYGLGMMIDAIAGGLSWAGTSREQPTRGGSGWIAIAIRIESFIDVTVYKQEVQSLIDWAKSSPTMPNVEKIYYPGEIEEENRRRRTADGVYIEPSTWERIGEAAAELGVAVPTEGVKGD